MPVYLLHGFRWPRDGFQGVRVHSIVHNLEDCSVEYIQNDKSHVELIRSFRTLWPDIMKEIEVNGRTLEFIEQYDPEDESENAVTQPYAYVADKVVELVGNSIPQPETSAEAAAKLARPLLSINVEEVIANGPGLTTQAWEALADLRDEIAKDEKIGWWVVYNGDPERAYDTDEEDYNEEDEEEATTPTADTISGTALSNTPNQRNAPVHNATTLNPAVLTKNTPSAVRTSPGKGGVVPPQSPNIGPPVPPKTSGPSLGSRILPNRTKAEVVKPEAVLPTPKDEKIPEPPKLKEVAKATGFRKKFFGKRI